MERNPTSPNSERISWLRGRKLYLEHSMSEQTQPITPTPALNANLVKDQQEKGVQQLDKSAEVKPRRGRLHLRRHPLVEMAEPRIYKPPIGETLDNDNKNVQKNQETTEKPSTSNSTVDNKDDALKPTND